MQAILNKANFLAALVRVRCLSEANVTVTISQEESFIVTSNEESKGYGNPALQIKSYFTTDGIKNQESMIFSFNAKKLIEMIKSLAGEHFKISLRNNKAVIEKSKVRFNLDVSGDITSSAWSVISNFRKVSLASLSFLIEKSIYAISGKEDDCRFYESSLLLDKGDRDGFARMVATDGHVLTISEAREEALSADLPSKGILLPYQGVKALLSLLGIYADEEEAIDYGFTDSMLEIRLAGTETIISMGFINREYPDYRRILSSQSEKGKGSVSLNSDVLNTLKRISIMSDVVSFTASMDNIKVTSLGNIADEGAFEEVSGEYKSSDVEEMSVNFNGKYIVNALKVAFDDSEEVEMLIEDNKSAVLVRGKGPMMNMYHSAIIMPMLVN